MPLGLNPPRPGILLTRAYTTTGESPVFSASTPGLAEPKGPKAKRKKLSKDPIALERIKVLWAHEPRPSYANIVREIGYSKTTTVDNIKAMQDRGEIKLNS